MLLYLGGPLRVARRAGFSLVEMLVAAALSLLLMLVAVNGFGLIGSSISDNRAYIELSGRLRSAQHRLQADLRHVTAKMTPPLDPKHELGYLEIIEGPGPWVEVVGETFALGSRPVKADGSFDSSVGDVDDAIMFTTRSHGEPFVGTWQGSSVQSQVAEVAWFVRGNKLYRRQLLVLPNRGSIAAPSNYFNTSSVSVRAEGGQTDHRTGWESRARQLTANTLGDLTKRENRFAHQPAQFPHDARFWGQLGLPTHQETSDPAWPFPAYPGGGPGLYVPISGWVDNSGNYPYVASRDYWTAPLAGLPLSGEALANFDGGPRAYEDVILTNVIGFDVKVWDAGAPVFDVVVGTAKDEFGNDYDITEPVLPTDPLYKQRLASGATPLSAGAFVDLYYTRGTGSSINTPFSGPGHPRSGLQATSEARSPAVYCTWSTHYENDGIDTDGDGTVDQGSDGLDQDGAGGVDDPAERETMPPYPVPLKAVQIIIRVFDADSGNIRQVTVQQDF